MFGSVPRKPNGKIDWNAEVTVDPVEMHKAMLGWKMLLRDMTLRYFLPSIAILIAISVCVRVR